MSGRTAVVGNAVATSSRSKRVVIDKEKRVDADIERLRQRLQTFRFRTPADHRVEEVLGKSEGLELRHGIVTGVFADHRNQDAALVEGLEKLTACPA